MGANVSRFGVICHRQGNRIFKLGSLTQQRGNWVCSGKAKVWKSKSSLWQAELQTHWYHCKSNSCFKVGLTPLSNGLGDEDDSIILPSQC